MEPISFYNNSIFWVEVDRIRPNPYQPRKDFDETRLQDLADSIRQYGVLQPLVVTRHEEVREDEGLSVSYELIAGERRLRASKIAGLSQVPVIIRSGEETGKVKLELALIENVQREDLNSVDRAKAFGRLAEEFGYKHNEIAKKIGKSREYVSNTIRVLALPEEMQIALIERKITEGHTRPLLMLADRPEERDTLFKEMVYKKLTVRESESIARRIAVDRVRKKKDLTPELIELERELTESLGTRVHIEQGQVGGKILIDFFSPEDLHSLLLLLKKDTEEKRESPLSRFIASVSGKSEEESQKEMQEEATSSTELDSDESSSETQQKKEEKEDEDAYSVKNFSI